MHCCACASADVSPKSFLGLTRFRYCACSAGVCQAADDMREYIRNGGAQVARRSKPSPYCRSLVSGQKQSLVCENRPPVHSRTTTVLMDELSALLVQHLHRQFGEPQKWPAKTVQDGCRDILPYLDLLATFWRTLSVSLTATVCPGAASRHRR